MNKYLKFARKLKNQWNINVLVKLIVSGALGMVPKCLEKAQGRINTI